MLEAFLVIVIIVFMALLIGEDFYIDHKIAKYGIEKNAVILDLEELGGRKGNASLVNFLVRVVNEENEEEDIVFSTYISPIDAPRVQPGKEVRIKYLKNKGKVKGFFV